MATLRLLVALAALLLAASALPTGVVETPADTPAPPADAQEQPSSTTSTAAPSSTVAEAAAAAVDSGTIIATTVATPVTEEETEEPEDLSDVPEPVSKDSEGPEVYSLHIRSDVKYRYATTLVTSRVVNRGSKAAEVTFQFVLPEKAFISGFLMEVREKVYKAYVKEKEEANKIYQAAVEQGHTAAQVAVSARDSNLFAVSVNIEPMTKMTFNLTYEELLTRRLGVYDHIIHLITSDKVVRDMKVEVAIEEPQNITKIKVPEPAGNNEIGTVPSDELVKITRPTPKSALITYAPSLEQQKKLNEKKKDENSLPNSIPEETSTQRLRVQYDVDHHSPSGDVLLRDGYFVHFFAPSEDSVEESRKRHKHVIFVLDTSGSMWGRKIQQLQEAMALILDSLDAKGDYFSIVQFSDSVKEWSPLTRESENSQGIHPVTSQNIEKAKKYIKTMEAYGGTNIAAALRSGIQIAARGLSGDPFRRTLEEQNSSSPLPQPLVIFLTDGEPTTGETRLSKILAGTRAMNTEARAPIFSLAFGNDADFKFVRKLSLQNHAFARRIYEAADATLQLESFFQEVSSPLLNNVTFSYVNPKVDQTSLTESNFHTYFAGTEVIVAGRVNDPTISKDDLGTTVVSSSSSASMSVSTQSSTSDAVVGKSTTTTTPPPSLVPLPMSNDKEEEKPASSAGVPAVEASQGVPPPSLEHDIIIPYPRFPPPRTPEQEVRKPEPGSLERLWAYLTIRQLLDQDLANEEERDPWEPVTTPPTTESILLNSSLSVIGVPISKEPTPLTPKQKALQLALQYGFVTPLTSLVVVKPPKKGVDPTKPVSSTFTDPLLEVPVAAHSGSFRPQAVASAGMFGPPGPLGLAAPFPSYGFAATHRPGPPPYTTTFSSFHRPSADISPEAEHEEDVLDSATTMGGDGDEDVAKHLTIEDIEWYEDHVTSEGQFNFTQPGLPDELYAVDNRTWKENDTHGKCQTPGKQEGFCRHLSTCVQATFVKDYTQFIPYFCSIDKMAGVCCPNAFTPPPSMEVTNSEKVTETDSDVHTMQETSSPSTSTDKMTEEKIST
ncbi:inter alpha-trypsin inhibitor, heavy chain 4-like isoform X3 [Ischnura elegans]|uniref:inter alpha-trypsin inhibitor, heavy chain 4-like isoform X3 n=1 Tax=Ischnura elegans TaxID=197161 RepID=UPI001ED86834|nr:inter alpha-trypsin inhibitor, heavy chain 4-like isoform X3 [Ischnura elegans]